MQNKLYHFVTGGLLALLLLSSYTAFAQDKSLDSPSPKNFIKKFEKDIYSAVQKHQTNLLSTILDSSYTGTFGQGHFDKEQQLKFIKALELSDYQLSHIEVRMPREDLAVITYKVRLEGRYKQESFSFTHHASTTWINKGETWDIIQHSSVEAQ